MRYTASVAKHGIAPVDALRAAQWPIWIENLDEPIDGQHRELRLGFDPHGRLLETVVIVDETDGDELLIHAMKARKQYIELID